MNYYNLCNKHIGRNVRITDRHNRVHRGTITRVTRTHVWIKPHGGQHGYGYWGGGWGGGWGYPVGLGLITGFALGALFF